MEGAVPPCPQRCGHGHPLRDVMEKEGEGQGETEMGRGQVACSDGQAFRQIVQGDTQGKQETCSDQAGGRQAVMVGPGRSELESQDAQEKSAKR